MLLLGFEIQYHHHGGEQFACLGDGECEDHFRRGAMRRILTQRLNSENDSTEYLILHRNGEQAWKTELEIGSRRLAKLLRLPELTYVRAVGKWEDAHGSKKRKVRWDCHPIVPDTWHTEEEINFFKEQPRGQEIETSSIAAKTSTRVSSGSDIGFKNG